MIDEFFVENSAYKCYFAIGCQQHASRETRRYSHFKVVTHGHFHQRKETQRRAIH